MSGEGSVFIHVSVRCLSAPAVCCVWFQMLVLVCGRGKTGSETILTPDIQNFTPVLFLF